jgi:hypothetical protein
VIAKSSPAHPVEFGDTRRGEKARECHDQIFWVPGASTMNASGRREDHPGMVLARRRPSTHDAVEILGVLDDHGSTVGTGLSQKLFIWESRQLGEIGCRLYVVAVSSQPASTTCRV